MNSVCMNPVRRVSMHAVSFDSGLLSSDQLSRLVAVNTTHLV